MSVPPSVHPNFSAFAEELKTLIHKYAKKEGIKSSDVGLILIYAAATLAAAGKTSERTFIEDYCRESFRQARDNINEVQ